MLQDSNPIFDLRPTLAEYKSEWWTSTNDFLQVYVPRNPIRKPDIFYAYLQKVSTSRKCNRLCRLISTPNTNFPRSNICSVKDSIIKELNSRIFKLEATIQQKRSRLEEDRALEVKKKWEEDYRKRSYAFMNSDHMKQAMARCTPKKRSHSVAVKTDSWFKDLSRINSVIDNIWISEDLDIYLGQPSHLRWQCTLDHFSNPVASSFLYASGLSALMPEINLSNSSTVSKSENKGIVPTEMELILEQTQQGISHEVSVMRTASATAKPCQGDSSEFYLITSNIYTDQRETVVLLMIGAADS
ncbi:hypothetical protein Tco_0065325 [Tanacetum coccineum]